MGAKEKGMSLPCQALTATGTVYYLEDMSPWLWGCCFC